MWFGIVSLFPDMVRNGCSGGVLARAIGDGVVAVEIFNPRDFTSDKHRTVDDRPYGGGPGMVMLVEPLLAAIESARNAGRAAAGTTPRVIYLSPQGETLSQGRVGQLADTRAVVFVAGRYEGIDERVLELAVDEELSIGDYVLSGGELPALVVLDAVARLLPGTLGNAESAVNESHLDGLLDYPHYTRPEAARGCVVPAVLLSGDHRAVFAWRRKMALQRTWTKRPDLLAGRTLSSEDQKLLREGLDEITNRPVTNEG